MWMSFVLIIAGITGIFYYASIGGLGEMPDLQVLEKTKTSLAFSFDTAVCAKGLLDCYSLTNEKKYFEYAEKFVEWIKVSIETNGTVKPYKDLEKNIFMENDDVWYKQKGCLNIKSSGISNSFPTALTSSLNKSFNGSINIKFNSSGNPPTL